MSNYENNKSVLADRPTSQEWMDFLLLPTKYRPIDFYSDGFDEILKIVRAITSKLSDDYSKVKAINDWVSGNIWYDYDYYNNTRGMMAAEEINYRQNIAYTPYEFRRGTCNDYIALTYDLLCMEGIPAIMVAGYADNGAHGWLEVFVNDRWIFIDPTWDSNNSYRNGEYSEQRDGKNVYFDSSLIDFSEKHRYLDNYNSRKVPPNHLHGVTGITRLTIPDCITDLGSVFLGESSIEHVIIPGSIKVINTNAFQHSKNLRSATLLEGVMTIGQGAFSYSGLESIDFPSSLTIIEASAFLGCMNLTQIMIPKSVTVVKSQAFMLSGLTHLTIPATVTEFGSYGESENLTHVTIYTSADVLGSNKFNYCKNLADVEILGGGNIQNGAFSRLESLTNVTIGYGVTSIGDNAFDTSGLKNITIPDSVTSIGTSAFAYTSLTSITIPDSVTSIGDMLLLRCYNLNEVILGNGITSIGTHAFSDCTSLTSITIPASVTKISEDAFSRIPVSGMTIYGYAGSYAKEYANKYKITFVEISADAKPSQTASAPAPDITVLFNGIKVNFTQPLIERNGFVFYPLEDIMETFAGGHGWNAETFTVSGELNGNVVEIPLNNLSYIVNGSVLEILPELVPFVEGIRTYVYIDYILEGFGLTVEWNGDTRIISVTN